MNLLKILILCMVIALASPVYADPPVFGTPFGLQLTDCTGVIWEGQPCWDYDSDTLCVGSGSACVTVGNLGDVVGPASSTDNAIVRFDSTTGKLLQDTSTTTIDDDGKLTSTVTLDNATGNEVAWTLNYTTNKAAGNDTGLLISMTDTASPGTSLLFDAQTGGSSRFFIDSVGNTTAYGNVNLSGGLSTNVLYPYTGGYSISFRGRWNYNAAGGFVDITPAAALTNTSGASDIFSIQPTYNQASGTAANTDFLINRTQTAVGSGTQRLVSAQVGSVEKLGVDNKGITIHSAADYAGTPVVPTRGTNVFVHTRSLAADGDDACGGTDDCLTLPIPTTMGYLEIWTGGSLYLSAICVNAGTCTVITDSDAAGTDIEYNAAIAACEGLCLHDGGTNSIIFNDTAGAVVTTVRFTYD